MTDREYQKMRADARRGVSRKYGFRQSSYINFKVEDGYFFCLYFLTDVRLTVKPMYADDLWWDIWESTENKNEPLSLRGTGAYSLPGQVLATYEIKDTTDRSELESLFEQVFYNASAEIKKFIADNPDADHFYPNESKMDHDPDRLLYLMALIHNGREEDVLAIIKDARKNKHRCMFHSGMFSDSYTYIRRWCNGKSIFRGFHKLILAHLTCSGHSENILRVSTGHNTETRERKSWYRLLPEWVYWIIFAPIYLPIFFYFFDLHRRTLYDIHWWIWGVGCMLFAVYFLVLTIKNGLKGNGFLVGTLMSVTFGVVSGIMAVGVCIGLFDGINRLFASEPINKTAIVTNMKFHHVGRGRGDFSRFITVVKCTPDNKTLKIDDVGLYNVPPQSEVMISYRQGLFGIDIFDNFNYMPE